MSEVAFPPEFCCPLLDQVLQPTIVLLHPRQHVVELDAQKLDLPGAAGGRPDLETRSGYAILFALMSTPTPPAHRPDLRDDDGRLARGRRSRARIRAAARELFRERGFDGATLRAIAARAGMGASSIYRHVRSKEELYYFRVFAEHFGTGKAMETVGQWISL